MAVQFVAASSQRIVNAAPPITTVPFTVGMLVLPTTGADQSNYFSLTDTAGDVHYFAIGQVFASFVIAIRAGGSLATSAIATLSPNQWHFLVGRFISSTNRRFSVLFPDGSISHAQNTSSNSPSGIDAMSLGCNASATPFNFMTGSIGEFWITNTDIQDDGTQLNDDLIRQLAYGGPFSVPHIASNVIDYRSLRKHPTSDGDELGEVYDGAFGRQTWTNTGGATIGPHPPLPYWYRKPGQRRRYAFSGTDAILTPPLRTLFVIQSTMRW